MLRTKRTDASLTVGNTETTGWNLDLLFPLSNKTMAPHRLIKWVIKGVRSLPSASNISLFLHVSHSLTLSHWAIVSPPHCFSPCIQSGLSQSDAACRINAYLGNGSDTLPRPTPVRGYGNSNYLLNNYLFAIIFPSAYQCRQVQRDGPAHTLSFLWQRKWWRWICRARKAKHTTCMLSR